MPAVGRRTVIIAVAMVAIGVVGVGFLALRANRGSGGADAQCAPEPCVAPHGFEAYFSNVHVAGERVLIEVRFTNHTTAGRFEAVSYRHTSPADFHLRWPDGSEHAATFAADCPNWGEVNVERGATVGPEPLCFDGPSTGVPGTQIVWDPDLGLLSTPIATPLG